MPSNDFRQVLLQGQPQDNFRALGLIRSGYAPDFAQTLPLAGEPALLQLLTGMAGSQASQPPLEVLWQIYSTPSPALTSELTRYRRRLLENLWSVRYLLTDPDTGADIVRHAPQVYNLLLQYGEPLQMVGIEKRYYLPRLYFRTGVVAIGSGDAFIRLLSKPGALRPFQQVAILNPAHRAQAAELMPDAVSPRITAAGSDWLEAEVTVPAAGYLVLADAYSSAWRAQVDGQDAGVEIANGFQGAVWLEMGSHRVRFTGLTAGAPNAQASSKNTFSGGL